MPYIYTTHTHFFPHSCTPELGSFNFLPNLGSAHSVSSYSSQHPALVSSALLVTQGNQGICLNTKALWLEVHTGDRQEDQG